MNTHHNSDGHTPDTAAVFAAALSLWQAGQKQEDNDAQNNLSKCFQGMDQFWRELMRIASEFEGWACRHVAFEELDAVWPFLLQERFGRVCLDLVPLASWASFDHQDCLRAAMRLRLPIKHDGELPLPVDFRVANPIPGSGFKEYRIQSVRVFIEDGDAVPFTADDEPYSEEYESPYFSLYGVDGTGGLEHIADRAVLAEMLRLVEKLAPGVRFPETATCRYGET